MTHCSLSSPLAESRFAMLTDAELEAEKARILQG